MAWIDTLKANPLIAFVLAHLEIFIVIGIAIAGVILAAKYFSKRQKFKIIDRSEIERKKFVERMRLNKARNNFFFYHGNNLIGRIIFEKREKILNDKKEVKLGFLVVKPVMWKLFTMGKEIPLIVNLSNAVIGINSMVLNELVPIHNFSGIFYDETLEGMKMENKGNVTDFIKNDFLMRTSFEDAMSVFYVKAMEQATFDPAHAQSMQMKQADIEQEKEKHKALVD